jgi:hypothetical protein
MGRAHVLVGLNEVSWWKYNLLLSAASGAKMIEASFVRLCCFT